MLTVGEHLRTVAHPTPIAPEARDGELFFASMTPAVLASVILMSAPVTAAASPTGAHRPTRAEITVQTRAAVAASGAVLVGLKVVAPNQSFALTIRVAHPAHYLKYRVNPLVDVINRLTKVQWRFLSRSFTVRGPSDRVFWIDQTLRPRIERTSWGVRPDLERCVKTIPFDIEIDPENVSRPCLA